MLVCIRCNGLTEHDDDGSGKPGNPYPVRTYLEKFVTKLLASMMLGCVLAAGGVAFADGMSKAEMAKHQKMMKDCMAKRDGAMGKDAAMKTCEDMMSKDATSKDKMSKERMGMDAKDKGAMKE